MQRVAHPNRCPTHYAGGRRTHLHQVLSAVDGIAHSTQHLSCGGRTHHASRTKCGRAETTSPSSQQRRLMMTDDAAKWPPSSHTDIGSWSCCMVLVKLRNHRSCCGLDGCSMVWVPRSWRPSARSRRCLGCPARR